MLGPLASGAGALAAVDLNVVPSRFLGARRSIERMQRHRFAPGIRTKLLLVLTVFLAIPWLGWACGECDYCITGWETLCERQKNTGYGVDGGWGEYALGYASYVGKVPDGIDPFEAAPLTCAGVTTYKAVKVSGARSSDPPGASWTNACTKPGSPT